MRADDATYTLLEVTAIAQTDLALLCVIDGKNHWVPQSQIHDDSEVFAKGHSGKLVVSEWWAEQEGLSE